MWFQKSGNGLGEDCVRWKVHPDFANCPDHLEFIRKITRRATPPKIHTANIETSDCNCARTRPGCEIHYIEITLEEWNDLMRWHQRIKVPIMPAGACHCRRPGALRQKEVDVLDWYYPTAAACDGADLKKMYKEALQPYKDDFMPIRKISCCFEGNAGASTHLHFKSFRSHLGMLRRHTH